MRAEKKSVRDPLRYGASGAASAAMSRSSAA
jgi:hypothetical protein